MSDKILSMLGLMRRANAIEIGEINSGSAVKSGKAKILLLASDASDNARHRAEGFVFGHNTILTDLPYTKEEISMNVGVNGCSMAAVTDIGFANALMNALSATDSEKYSVIAEEVNSRFAKAERRKNETAAHKRNKWNGKRRTNII